MTTTEQNEFHEHGTKDKVFTQTTFVVWSDGPREKCQPVYAMSAGYKAALAAQSTAPADYKTRIRAFRGPISGEFSTDSDTFTLFIDHATEVDLAWAIANTPDVP